MTDTSGSPQSLSMRLIFEYEGDNVRLVMQQPVDMVVTGFDVARTQREGYYIDTRDASDRTLARVPARGAFQASAEVFPEHPGEPITRVEVPNPRGAFTVIVPVPQDANHVSVVHVTPPQPGLTARAPQEREIARFPLNISR